MTQTIHKTWVTRRKGLNADVKILPTSYGNKYCQIRGNAQLSEEELWAQSPDATGAQIVLDKLVVVDVDKAFNAEVRLNTYAVRSLRGIHIYYRLPDGLEVESGNSTTISGVEIKAPGSRVTVADTLVGDRRYDELTSWDTLRELTEDDIRYWGISMINTTPEKIEKKPQLRAVQKDAAAAEEQEKIEEGARNRFLFNRVIKPLAWSIVRDEDIIEFADKFSKTNFDKPLALHEIEASVRGVDRPYPAKKLVGKLIAPESCNSLTIKAALRREGVMFRYDKVAGRPEYKYPNDKTWSILEQNDNGKLSLDLKETYLISVYKTHEEKNKAGDKVTLKRMSNPSHLSFHKDTWKEIIEQQVATNSVVPFFDDYLSKLEPWDGTKRLNSLLSRFFTLDEPSQKLAEWIIPAMFRAVVLRNTKDDSYKFDMMPIFIGYNGIGKSTIIRQSVPQDRPEWINDSIQFDCHHKEFMEQTMQAIFVEYQECKGIKKAPLGNIKATLSGQDDMHRIPYKQYAEKFSRRCVLFGTSNEIDVLPSDPDGHRRFVVLNITSTQNKTDEIRAYMQENRDQLWAEAINLSNEDDHKWTELPVEMQDVRVKQARKHSDDFDIENALDIWLEHNFKGEEQIIELSVMTNNLGLDGDRKAEKTKVSKVLKARNYEVATKYVKALGRPARSVIIK